MKRELEERPAPVNDRGYVELALAYEEGVQPPQSMRCLLYDPSGALIKETTGVTGVYRDTLPAGRYRLLVHNEDARNVEYRGTDRYETAGVYARETQRINSTRHEAGVPCILQPQMVFAAGTCKEFGEVVVAADETTKATIAPMELTRQVSFRFIVQGVGGVQSLGGVLTGVSPGIFLSSGKQDGSSSCAVEFSGAPREGSLSDYTTQINVFNLLATADSPAGTCTVSVTLRDSTGKPYSGTFDITHTLKDILLDSGGTIPVEIPIEMTLEVKGVGELRATAVPWDLSGGGNADFN